MLFPRRKWKDITEIEELKGYQISNIGELRSVDRYVVDKNGRKRFYKGQPIKPQTDTDGYLRITRKNKVFPIHRLVALHFVDGYFDGAVVNHKDENKQNNIWTNLEWCTKEYNNSYGTINERRSKKHTGKKMSKESREKIGNKSKGRKQSKETIEKRASKLRGKNNYMAKRVLCITTGEEFDCMSDAEEKYNPNHKRTAGCISACLKRGTNKAYGMEWTYI